MIVVGVHDVMCVLSRCGCDNVAHMWGHNGVEHGVLLMLLFDYIYVVVSVWVGCCENVVLLLSVCVHMVLIVVV